MMRQFRDPRELRHEAACLLATAAAIEDGTWAAIVDGPGTSASVVTHVGCTAQGANNRLRRLYDLGVLDRDRIVVNGGGKAFAYRVSMTAFGGRS